MPKHKENIHRCGDRRCSSGKADAGKQTHVSVYRKNHTEMKCKLPELSRKTELPSSYRKPKTMGEVIREWQNKNRLNHKGATEAKYDYMIKTHILPVMEQLDIRKITVEYLNAYAESKLKTGRTDKSGGLSASYVRLNMIILASVMKYAAEEQYCPPLKGTIYKPSIPKASLEIISPIEQARLEAYLFHNKNLTCFGILISLYMGLRIGEICALAWENVDFKSNVIHVAGTVARIKNTGRESASATCLVIDRPKTETSDRIIPIPSILLPLFREFYTARRSEYVLSDSTAFLNPRTYEYRYHTVLKRCGLPDINYHSLRHTFATRCIEAGVDIKTLSELLGHADVSVTLNTYVHSSVELKRKQIEKLCLIRGQ